MLYIFEVDIFVSSQLQLLVENEPGFRQVAIYLLIHWTAAAPNYKLQQQKKR